MEWNLLTLAYIIASVTFILGLKMLAHPETARRGNLVAAAGMTIAIFATIFLYEEDGMQLQNYPWIFAALIIGTVAGVWSARTVKMTAMPEMVSLFNGMGGACAALIGIIEFNHLTHHYYGSDLQFFSKLDGVVLLIIMAGLVIGSISFAGSMIAWGKLNGRIKDFSFKGQHIVNLGLFAFILFLSAYVIILRPEATILFFYIVLFAALIYGVNKTI